MSATSIKFTILYQVLPWILPKRLHDSVLLLTDVEHTKQIKTLRWVIRSILKYQRIQASNSLNNNTGDQKHILQSIQCHNIQLSSQLNEIQRSLNSLASQSRIQQEDHFELERRLMEFKFGQDPMMLSSDSVFDNCSMNDSLSIDMRNIDMNLSSNPYK